jgi:hypothetical protein
VSWAIAVKATARRLQPDDQHKQQTEHQTGRHKAAGTRRQTG